MLRRLLALTSLVLAGMLVQPAAAQTYGRDPRITSGTLDNGMGYLLLPIEDVARGAAIRIIIDAGIIHESEGQFGAAEVAAEAMRLRLGGDAALSVLADHSVVGVDLADPSTLTARLSAMAGVAAAPAIPEEMVRTARAAASETLSRVGPAERVHDQAMRRLTPGSRAVRRPAAGLGESVRGLDAGAVNDFTRRWYVPSNMTLVVVAPRSAEELERLVRESFGPLPRVPRPASPAAPATSWSVPASPIVIEDPDLPEAMVALVSGWPARAAATPREFRTTLIQEVGLELLETLVRVRITKGKAPFTTASTERILDADGLAWARLQVSGPASEWRTLVSSAIAEVNRIRIHGLDRSEVRDALVSLAGQWERDAKAEDAAAAGGLADAVARTRGGASARQRLDTLLAMVASVSSDDVEWEFGKRFDPSAAAIVLALPARPGNPSESEVREVARGAWAAQPNPSSELVRPWTLVRELPTPGEVVEMSQDPATGVWSGWLDNGVRFHVRQMAGRQPGGVEFCLTIAGSELLEDATTRGLSEILGKSWELMGTPTVTSEQMFDLFRPSRTRMQSLGLSDHFRVVVAADRVWFNPYMQRLHTMLTTALPNPQVIDNYRQGIATQQQAMGSDVNLTFTRLMTDAQYVPSEARLRPPGASLADSYTAENLAAWMRRISECPMEICIAGDIDPEDAIEAVRFYLGSLPPRPRISTSTFSERRTPVLNPLPHTGQTRLTALGNPNAWVLRGFYIADPGDVTEADAFRIAANILSTRLTIAAPSLGLPSGGFVATNFVTAFPGTSIFLYGSQTSGIDADGARHIQQTAAREFERFAREGPTAEELASAVEQMAGEAEQSASFPSGWWDVLSMATYRGSPVNAPAQAPARIRAYTREQIRDTFARYLNRPDNVIELSVLPAPRDELLEFVSTPPPPPPIQADPDQPAGPPSGDPDRTGG